MAPPEQPSTLAIAAIRMAQHVLETRRERQAVEDAARRATMRVVKSKRTEAA